MRHLGKADEHPRPFPRPLDQPCIGEDLQVPRHARLALAEHQRKLADGELEPADERHDPQPGRIGESAKDGKRIGHAPHINLSLYEVNVQRLVG